MLEGLTDTDVPIRYIYILLRNIELLHKQTPLRLMARVVERTNRGHCRAAVVAKRMHRNEVILSVIAKIVCRIESS